MQKGGAVYIISSTSKSTIYTGVTSDLVGRIYEHRNKIYPRSFSARYNCVQLVYYKYYDLIVHAIQEEKRIKRLLREEKERLILSFNPEWRDLWPELELMW